MGKVAVMPVDISSDKPVFSIEELIEKLMRICEMAGFAAIALGIQVLHTDRYMVPSLQHP